MPTNWRDVLGLYKRRAVAQRWVHGSDFANRWSVLDYGAEGYVGQVGTLFGLMMVYGIELPVGLITGCAFREPRPTKIASAACQT